LRLVILHDYFYDEVARGGTTLVFLTLIAGLKKLGHEVIIAMNKKFTYEEAKEYFGETAQPDLIYKFRHDTQTVYKDLSLGRKLAGFVHPLRPDAVIQTFGHPILLYKIKCPKLFYVQSWRVTPLNKRIANYTGVKKILNIPFRILCRNEEKDIKFVAASHWVKRNFEKIWRTKAEVIYPPLRLKDFSSLQPTAKIKGKIVSLGKFTKVKRLQDQIEILRLLRDEGVNATLTMMGSTARDSDEVLEMINRLVQMYNLEEYVKVKLDISRQEILEELASSQIFLHTCTREAAGIAPLEGMAAGCVPCVPDSGGVREIVPPEFRFTNLLQAKEIIKKSINNPVDVNRLRETVKKYDEEHFVQAWINLIKEVS